MVKKHQSAVPPSMYFLWQEVAEPQAEGLLLSITCCNSRSLASPVAPGEPQRARTEAGSARSRPARAGVAALAVVSAGSRACRCLGSRSQPRPLLAGIFGIVLDCGLRHGRVFPLLR